MPYAKYKHEYIHNIPSQKDFDEMYSSMGGGICYPKYQFKWIANRCNNKIFEVSFNLELQYYYAGGFELLKIKDVEFDCFIESKKILDKAIRDIIGSEKDIKDFYDILSVEYKSPRKLRLYEQFDDKAVKGRFICHVFIELFNKIGSMYK